MRRGPRRCAVLPRSVRTDCPVTPLRAPQPALRVLLGRLAREVWPKQPSPMSVSWKTLPRTSQGVSLALSRADAIHPEVV
jgi:hypothetical protein